MVIGKSIDKTGVIVGLACLFTGGAVGANIQKLNMKLSSSCWNMASCPSRPMVSFYIKPVCKARLIVRLNVASKIKSKNYGLDR